MLHKLGSYFCPKQAKKILKSEEAVLCTFLHYILKGFAWLKSLQLKSISIILLAVFCYYFICLFFVSHTRLSSMTECVIYPEPSIITHMHGLSSMNVCQTDKTSYSPNCKSCISVSQIILQYLSTGKGKLKVTSISSLPWYHCYHFLSS